MTRPTQWSVGQHHGLVWPGGAALLDGSLDLSVAEAVWRRLGGDGDLAHFFAVLMEESGTSLLELPGFAVAVTSADHWQVAARGQFTAVTAVGGEERSVTGRDVTTWSEARVPRGVDLRLVADGAEPPGVARSVSSGIVPAHTLALADHVPAAAPLECEKPAVPTDEPPDKPGGLLDELFADEVATPELERDDRPTYEPPPWSDAPVTLVGDADPQVARGPTPYTVDDRSASSEDIKSVAQGADEPAGEEFADLWSEHTVMGPVEQAALRPPEARAPHRPQSTPGARAAAPPTDDLVTDARSETTLAGSGDSDERPTQPTADPQNDHTAEESDTDVLGDHDGKTVIQARAPLAPRTPPGQAVGHGEMVLAALCSAGHANPTTRSTCRRCGATLTEAPRQVPRPRVGRLRTSEGETIDLTGPVIVGREPLAARFQGTDIPRLVSIMQPHISASHVEIQVEGWDVLAADLRSTNGTYLRRLGHAPSRLSESAVPLQEGDVLDLGHGVHLTLEELA